MARRDEQQEGGVVLDDGTWVDVGPDGRWRPSSGERARAAAILGVAITALVLLALVLSVGGGRDDDQVVARGTTTSEASTTASTEAPAVDPASIDGVPPSPACAGDDREGSPLRERDEIVVLVLNATSRSGHAGEVSERLAGVGYTMTVPDNGGRREVTSVAFLAGWCAEAEQVAADLGLPEATIEPVAADLLTTVGRARVVVRLGADSL